ncbi:hypothetical protein QVG61_10460 [Thiohalobacter sp. IOR34]|uniref:hypothetical protein n=1 Tax=Thiohalobacter sp. IOR34 TaxID=3057176 RepID=UPI0025B1A03E|nr:hypothetical protein [Thiohalobacter sp. IOR34]WJW74917.1 hypothetical protein QVG61_10460 [Thiohalobacter sp. IOR34]
MTNSRTPHLEDCLLCYGQADAGLRELQARLRRLQADSDTPLSELIAAYDACYPRLERALWQCSKDDEFASLLARYQALFREQERLIQQDSRNRRAGDTRHDFILGIPVADRPAHLQACLESIHQVLERFGYGGKRDGRYVKIRIVVAEDSRHERNVQHHRELVDEYRQKGLQVVHFGQDEQYALLQSIPAAERELLGNILTRQPKDRFYLKGQAANRNLCYLKFLELTEDRDRTLYYLVDSDQAFCVNRQTRQGEEAVFALNYFHIIDRVFRTTGTLMLTGKLVGDPPVSPAVMAGGFLDDVAAFFADLAGRHAHDACRFHALPEHPTGDAAYHDMAGLFGFAHKAETFPYRCRIQGPHDHAACLRDFSQRLNAFFFGEHPTRSTHFVYGDGFDALTPARTIYPGNYVVNFAGLKYIIPFGHLRLRMSGPTAGRLIAAEIGHRFASINMPHLHQRTSQAGLQDNFRPGVELGGENVQQVDLSDEFERQFFGDLMLFTTERLVQEKDVKQPFTRDSVSPILARKETELLALYRRNRQAIVEANRKLEEYVFRGDQWWMKSDSLGNAMQQLRSFISNIDYNFGDQSPAWKKIQSMEHREMRKRQIMEALTHYRPEREAWDRLFA